MNQRPEIEQGPNPDPFAPSPVGLLGILRILFRWSWVVAPLVALTVWVALSQTDAIQPEHTASASLLLIGENEVLVEDVNTGDIQIEDVNPLRDLGGTLATIGEVLVLSMNSPSVTGQLVDEGLTDSIQLWGQTRSPILRIEASDVDPNIAVDSANRMAELTSEELASMQDEMGAPETDRIQVRPINLAFTDGADYGARDRIRIMIGVLGLAISAASAFFLEGISELWRRRKRRAQADTEPRALPSGEVAPDRLASFAPGTSDELIDAEFDDLVAVLHLITGSPGRAETIADQTLAETRKQWDVIEDDEPVNWLYRSAINRTATTPKRRPKDIEDGSLWDAVHALPDDTRAVLALSSIAELNDERIAAVMETSPSAVAQHRSDATDRLALIDETAATNRWPFKQSARSTTSADETDTATDSKRADSRRSSQKRSGNKTSPRSKSSTAKTSASKKAGAKAKQPTSKTPGVSASTATKSKNNSGRSKRRPRQDIG